MSTNKVKQKKKKGSVLRLAWEVEQYLLERRKKDERHNDTLRRILGLPSRKGDSSPVTVYFVVEDGQAPQVFREAPDARGYAIRLAVRKRTTTPRVIKVVEQI